MVKKDDIITDCKRNILEATGNSLSLTGSFEKLSVLRSSFKLFPLEIWYNSSFKMKHMSGMSFPRSVTDRPTVKQEKNSEPVQCTSSPDYYTEKTKKATGDNSTSCQRFNVKRDVSSSDKNLRLAFASMKEVLRTLVLINTFYCTFQL